VEPDGDDSVSDRPVAFAAVIGDVILEYDRAKVKHGENTLDGALSNDLLRLAALVEEVGEVAHELTYDAAGFGLETDEAARVKRLRTELVQAANVAITWASIL
jgi:hypothetical protein